MKRKQQYFLNALLMTAVALLMRTASVSFNVYVSNLVGAEAMGLLSLISGVYGFAVTLATSGIHLATVRVLSQRLERTGGAENGKCLRACLCYALFFGSLATLLLLLLARPIGLLALRDERTVRALSMLAITLLPIALTSVLNGYFTAVRRAWKNALAQVSEQGVKILLTCYLLIGIAPKTVEGCVLGILAGGAVSESLSLVFNVILYLLDRRHFKGIPPVRTTEKIHVSNIALPVAISAYARSGLLAIEHILIPRGLLIYGAGNADALAAYGSLHSMALPVVLYPAAVLSSFAALLIPEVTEQQSADNRVEIRYIAGRVYQMTTLFSVGVAGIMLFLSTALGHALYESDEVAHFIKLLSPLVPIMYMDTATDALLKGLGEQVYSMRVNIFDAFVSVICVAFLVPVFGIHGYVITIYITEILNAALSIARLLRVSGFRPRAMTLLLRPLLCVIGATCITRLLAAYLPFPTQTAGLVIAILLSATLYLLLLLATGGWHYRDLQWLVRACLPSKRTAKQP